MVIGKPVSLTGDGLGNLCAAVSDIDAIQSCKAVDQLVAMSVLNVDTLASLDNDRITKLAGCEVLQLGEGMENGMPVLLTDFRSVDRHDFFL